MVNKNVFWENKWAISIIALGFVLAIFPSLVYDLPVVQTDGASYYSYAKVFSETGDLNAKNPEWNKLDALETKISDYPPLFTVSMGFLLKFTGQDVFWLNGAYLAIFFVLANIFIYLLALELTKEYKESKKIALLALLFSVINVRAYYHIFTGQYPLFVSICFAIPAIYFTVKYLYERETKHFIWMIAFIILAGLTYMQQLLYIATIQFFILLGLMAKKNLKLNFPKISGNLKLSNQYTSDFLKVLIPTTIIFSVIFFIYGIMPGTSGRDSFVQGWISSMMVPVGGFQAVWQKFFITDGPIFFTMALAGILFLLYNQKWKILAPVFGGIFIVISGMIFFVNDPMAKMLVFKFYFLFAVLMSIPASIMFVRLLSNENTKKLFTLILVLCIIIQIAILSIFCKQVSPAITYENYAAAKFLAADNKPSVAYIYDRGKEAGFSSFKWTVVYARSSNYTITKSLPEYLEGYTYIYIVDKNDMSASERAIISGYSKVFNSNKVEIYRTIR